MNINTSKVYESDVNHTEVLDSGRRSSSDSGNQNPGYQNHENNYTIDDEEEFLFYNTQKPSII
jgi:hypothetical protein